MRCHVTQAPSPIRLFDAVRRVLATAFGTATLLLVAPPIAAQDKTQKAVDRVEPCRLSLSLPLRVEFRGARSRGYETGSGETHKERVQVTVRHTGGPCSYVLVVGPEQSGGDLFLKGDKERLAYEIGPPGSGAGPLGLGLTFPGTFGEGTDSHQISFDIAVPPDQYVGAGHYRNRLAFSLFDDSEQARVFMTTRTVEIGTTVPARVRASIGDDPKAGIRLKQIDFGQLRKGVRRSLGFSVSANTSVSIELTSENQGRLVHEHSDYAIPYHLSLNGRSVLGNDASKFLVDTETARHALKPDLIAEIGDVASNAPAGRYADRLTIVISAQ